MLLLKNEMATNKGWDSSKYILQTKPKKKNHLHELTPTNTQVYKHSSSTVDIAITNW